MDLQAILEDLQDYLAPGLDTYELAIYLYIFRHSRMLGKPDATIGFKSARQRISTGIGVNGTPMSEKTCYDRLRSLETKGCVRVLASERRGTRVQLFLPGEIPGIVPIASAKAELTLEEMDFFAVATNRNAILRREGERCFYCLKTLVPDTLVVEHTVSRPEGANGYRNVVAACRACNNSKGAVEAADFLRQLYRKGVLNDRELEERLDALGRTTRGERRPVHLG